MNNDLIEYILNYYRIHIIIDPKDINEIARFLVSALLLSHNIRRDTISIIKYRDIYLLAPGDRLRHLRPDLESALGWVRAVLVKGKARGLGAIVIYELSIDSLIEKAYVLETCYGENKIKNIKLNRKIVIMHHDESRQDCWLSSVCSRPCRAAIANIVLDRLNSGLPA